MNRFSFIVGVFFLFTFSVNAQVNMPTMRGAISSSKLVPTMFSGGVGLGSSQDQLVQNVCPPFVV